VWSYSLVLVVGIIANMDWDIMGIISLGNDKTGRFSGWLTII
jgi:hypothetical protein